MQKQVVPQGRSPVFLMRDGHAWWLLLGWSYDREPDHLWFASRFQVRLSPGSVAFGLGLVQVRSTWPKPRRPSSSQGCSTLTKWTLTESGVMTPLKELFGPAEVQEVLNLLVPRRLNGYIFHGIHDGDVFYEAWIPL